MLNINKRICYILALVMSLGLLMSCMDANHSSEERIIIEKFGYIEPSMALLVADVNNLEAVTELSSQIVFCKVNELNDVTYTDTNTFSFQYSVEILDILMDVNNRLNIGDEIPVLSADGMLKAADAAAMIKDLPRSQKMGILQGEYLDDEYVISSYWNAVPIEVGKSYIMFLTDRYLDEEQVYAECGYSYLFEYSDQIVYGGRDRERVGQTKDAIVERILSQIALRTGRADEVGMDQYISELGERQAQQSKKEQ